MFGRWAAGLGLAAIVALAGTLVNAQPPQGAPPGGAPRPPAATPKPGYVVPPENSAGLYPVNGEPIFKQRCASCHDPAVDRAPSKAELEGRSPEEMYDALT